MTTSNSAPVTTSLQLNQAPPTIEGWATLHECWHLDSGLWYHLDGADRVAHVDGLIAWLDQARLRSPANSAMLGDAACFLTVGQKSDLMVLLYRKTLTELQWAQVEFRRIGFAGFVRPAGSFVAMVEASLYEAAAIAEQKIKAQGLLPGSSEYNAALAAETDVHKALLQERVFKPIPQRSHCCYYPMSKRRGETYNWYALPMEERRALMRGHGRLGHRYHGQVEQVVQGAIGLDDWEWAVDLHADDPVLFKKLVTEMRFDPASSRYADFGPFTVGLRADNQRLRDFLLTPQDHI